MTKISDLATRQEVWAMESMARQAWFWSRRVGESVEQVAFYA